MLQKRSDPRKLVNVFSPNYYEIILWRPKSIKTYFWKWWLKHIFSGFISKWISLRACIRKSAYCRFFSKLFEILRIWSQYSIENSMQLLYTSRSNPKGFKRNGPASISYAILNATNSLSTLMKVFYRLSLKSVHLIAI